MATEVALGGKNVTELAVAATELPSPSAIVAAILIQMATDARAAY